MPLVKRSFSLSGHRTSVALEPAFWVELDRLAADRGEPLARLVGRVDADRTPDDGGLASALRLTVVQALRQERDRSETALTLGIGDGNRAPGDAGPG